MLDINTKRKKKREISKIYNEAYNLLYASLCYFSTKFIKDTEKAKDLVQEVFIRLWSHEVLLAEMNVIKAFLYISVRNKSLDYLKSKEYKIKSNSISDDIQLISSETYLEKEVLMEEIFRLVDDAIKTLPFKCQEIVRLSMQGSKNIDISEELGISINTVKMQKRIAYKKLKELLKDQHIYTFVCLLIED